MDAFEESHDLLECVAASEQRRRALARLEDGPGDLRDLADSLHVPRTTLRHNLKNLVAADLVAHTGGEYRITPLGEAALDGLREFDRHVALARDLSPFLSRASDGLSLQRDWITDPSVTVADTAHPFRAVRRLFERVRGADTADVVLPFTPFDPVDGRARWMNETRRTRVLLTTGLVGSLDAEERDALRDGGAGDVHIRVDCWESSYGFARLDEGVVVVESDDTGKPHVALEDDGDAVAAWADREFERVWEGAEPLARHVA